MKFVAQVWRCAENITRPDSRLMRWNSFSKPASVNGGAVRYAP